MATSEVFLVNFTNFYYSQYIVTIHVNVIYKVCCGLFWLVNTPEFLKNKERYKNHVNTFSL